MTNSISTTIVEVTKNKVDTDRLWCIGLCQDVITKTS